MPTHPPCVFFLVLFYLLLVNLLIHPPLPLALAQAHSKCKESFHCGDYGTFQFPFTDLDNSECGLFFVNCTTAPPLIRFSFEGDWLQIQGNYTSAATKFQVLDPLLNPGKCPSPGTPPYNSQDPFSSFTIYPCIPLLSCPKNVTNESKPSSSHFKLFQGCDDEAFDLYYTGLDCRASIKGITDRISEKCRVVHLPLKDDHPSPQVQLSPKYEVEWHVSPACNFSCYLRGGTCLVNATTQQVYCHGAVTDQQKPKDEGDQQKAKYERYQPKAKYERYQPKAKYEGDHPMAKDEGDHQQKAKDEGDQLKLILVAVICGSAFLVLCFVVSFLILRRHRKNKLNGPYLLSRSISSGPSSSTSDLQLGGGRFFLGILVFSYQELQEATNNFDPSKELGEGGFGIVYYGKLRDGREVAIKRLYEHNCRRVEQFLNEIKILADLRHPNLVTLFGCASRRSRELLLVYEYIPNGTVADHLHGEMAQTSPLTWPVRMTIAVETASALAYLHKKDIIHRDVKTYNILLDNNFSVKVADFGLSRLFPNDVSHISTAPQGTPGYVDPEYHQCYQLTDKSDVYSFGVVLIELISSMPPVDITRHRHEINLANLAVDRIQRCAFDELIDSSLGHQTDAEVARMTMSVAELAFRCLQLEKDLRPSMDEVLEFLKDIQAREDCNLEKKERSNGKYFVPGKLLTSPETDDAVLLKGNIPSSPVTVTNTWPSVTVVAPPPQVP